MSTHSPFFPSLQNAMGKQKSCPTVGIRENGCKRLREMQRLQWAEVVTTKYAVWPAPLTVGYMYCYWPDGQRDYCAIMMNPLTSE